MRKSWSAALTLATAALATTLGAVPASATTSVLTVGSVGGPPAQVGDVLTSSGTANFSVSPTSTAGIRCNVAARATVQTNPPAPGTAVTFLTTLPFSSCVSSISGFVVGSVTADNLPYRAAFASSLAVSVSGGPTGGPLQVTIVGNTGDLTIICKYQPDNGQIPGRYSNSDNSITASGVQFKKVSGSTLCPAPLLFGARLAPLVDGSQTTRLVFVN